MPFILQRPKTTPMYEAIYDELEKYYNEDHYFDNFLKPGPGTGLQILSKHLGLYRYHKDYFGNGDIALNWFHICHPRILYKKIQRKKSFEGYNNYTTTTYTFTKSTPICTAFNNLDQKKCINCGYGLTKNEEMLLKLLLLGKKL